MNDKHHKNRIALGVFELAVFLRKGAERFPSDKASAYRSFAVVLFLSLVSAILLYLSPTERVGARPLGELFFLYCVINFSTSVVFFGVVYFLCGLLDKREHFWNFVTMNNYTALAPALVTLPLALSVIYGPHSWEEIYNLLIVIFFYGVALRGFIATHALRVPWEFGGAIGFFGMFAYQAVSGTVFALWGIS